MKPSPLSLSLLVLSAAANAELPLPRLSIMEIRDAAYALPSVPAAPAAARAPAGGLVETMHEAAVLKRLLSAQLDRHDRPMHKFSFEIAPFEREAYQRVWKAVMRPIGTSTEDCRKIMTEHAGEVAVNTHVGFIRCFVRPTDFWRYAKGEFYPRLLTLSRARDDARFPAYTEKLREWADWGVKTSALEHVPTGGPYGESTPVRVPVLTQAEHESLKLR